MSAKRATSNPAHRLEAYNAKRRFELTDEPRGRPSTGAAPRGGVRRFVVQQHQARRMHYDLRLELDGVLLSWAVPKGPSLSPADKRLAVRTEDHPLSYRHFEGRIAPGLYGAGAMIVWDQGTWQPQDEPREALQRGRLHFELQGQKLCGGFSLVRTRGEGEPAWLLIKRADAAARSGRQADITRHATASVISGRTVQQLAAHPEPAPALAADRTSENLVKRSSSSRSKRVASPADRDLPDLRPQLATAVDRAPRNGEWRYEIKFDGYRMLAWVDGDRVQLCTRNGGDWSKRLPGIASALADLGLRNSVLDGEVCFVDDDGRTRFQGLQTMLGEKPGDRRAAGASVVDSRLRLFLFDLLVDQGRDVRAESLLARKARLRRILPDRLPSALAYSQDVQGDGGVALGQACAAGLEGLIAKRADAPYRGGRGSDWLKLKCHRRQEFTIVGYTEPKGARSGFGALLLAVREDGRWVYRGKVGSGFDHAMRMTLLKRLTAARTSRPVLQPPPRIADATWVRPTQICEVQFTEVTASGMLRHPVFVGQRHDKSPLEIHDEATVSATQLESGRKRSAPPAPAQENEMQLHGVTITHPQRLMDPSSATTKADLARYLDRVSGLLLPFASERPLALVRCPQGDAQACFFQKKKPAGMGPAVRSAQVHGQQVLYVRDVRGLMQLVQFNAVELHGWGCRIAHRKQPDTLVMDLDPDPALHFAQVVEAALQVRDLLRQTGLRSFVKTTGGKGLHVVAPLQPRADWEQLSSFAKALALAMEQFAPERYVANMSKAKRRGRIFIDYLRNAVGATAVLPYSPRARNGCTVAMPVSWRELPRVHAQEFSVSSAQRWMARRRRDPWQGYAVLSQSLPDLEALQRLR